MSKKYFQNMTKSERREYKRYCKNEQQQKLLPQTRKCRNISPELILNKASPGIALGYQKCEPNSFIGIPQGTEGNMIVLGGTGSGKSTGICRPTIAAWKGPLCVTDIKGELSSSYQKLQQQGAVVRPFIKFDPMQENSPSYDPFFLLSKDGEENLVNNIWDIVVSIIPLSCNEKEPFWTQSEQSVFAAALHYYYKQGLDFIETLLIISDNSLIELIQSIAESNNKIAKMYIGELAKIKGETLSAIDRGLRNKLILFATNPFICRALSSKEKNRNCFSWDDLETSNIFLCIPEDKIEQFSSMVNLMYSQLIKHLERRPDKYSREGKMNSPVLILMDEFARFGKLSPISNAIATLRSKSVNICLVLQSLAQLDKVYGTDERRIILDNCQYYAILRVNDLDT
ncbi:MAG TPA: hypothetical protein DDX91_07045 [Ruminococcaceae bacterium]|nr:hypothetical protein [Oscillospiraceae bacterium]